MTPKIVLALVLTVAVLLAWVRLALWQRSASVVPGWRLALLVVLQPACAALLFFCLFPPGTRTASGNLVVATAGAPQTALAKTGGATILLPEARRSFEGEAAPDLATALRRHPDVRNLHLVGAGLTPRDREAAKGLGVAFDPLPLPAGFIAIEPPARVAPGAGFQVGGQISELAEATVDLIDPAGRVTDTQTTDAQGRFVVSGTARSAGAATFVIRLRDGRGRTVEQADVPVLVESASATRVLIIGGAPGPEVKYLRRWAADAGFAVTTQVSAGGGVALADPPIAITAENLRRFDLAIIDDRSWEGLGGGRAEVLAAVREGLGLILRTGGSPDDGARSQWRSLGFSMTGGGETAPIALPAPLRPEVARTRRGIAPPDAVGLEEGDDVLPEISRLGVAPGGSDVVSLVRDASGTTLSAWRASGRGRIAVFTGIDSFGLTLTGRSDLYGDWWGAMLTTVSRPAGGADLAFSSPAWVDERIALCGLGGAARVEAADGSVSELHIDPASPGCAGFWPTMPGWHLLRRTLADGSAQVWPFFVHPTDQLTGVRMARDRDATLMLRGPSQGGGEAAQGPEIPGSPWPWFVALLTLAAAMWWFERSSVGRPVGRAAGDA
jgi:hypothetical protein